MDQGLEGNGCTQEFPEQGRLGLMIPNEAVETGYGELAGYKVVVH